MYAKTHRYIGKIYTVTRISKVTLHFKTGNMNIAEFLMANEFITGIVSAGFLLTVALVVVWYVRREGPKPIGSGTEQTAFYYDRTTEMSLRDFLIAEKEAKLVDLAHNTPVMPPPDIKQTRTGAMIGDKIATVTRTGKFYTGKCGEHEVIGFSIPEVLHELAEAVNREITANQ